MNADSAPAELAVTHQFPVQLGIGANTLHHEFLEGLARPAGGIRALLDQLRTRLAEEGGELRMRAGVERDRSNRERLGVRAAPPCARDPRPPDARRALQCRGGAAMAGFVSLMDTRPPKRMRLRSGHER